MVNSPLSMFHDFNFIKIMFSLPLIVCIIQNVHEYDTYSDF